MELFSRTCTKSLWIVGVSLLTFFLGCSAPEKGYEKEVFFELPEKVAPLQDGEEALRSVRKLLSEKRYAEAARLAHRLARQGKTVEERAQGEFLLGECYYRSGNYIYAFTHYQRVAEVYSQSSMVLKALERMYEIGAAWLHGRQYQSWDFTWTEDRDRGREILEKLLKQYPYLRTSDGELLGDDMCLMLADYYYQQEDYEQAREYYQKLLKSYRRSEWRELAFYRIGLTYLNEADSPVYDQAPWHKALRQFERYLRRYPKGNFLAKAKKHLSQIRETLAGHTYDIALFYYRRGHYVSAVIYLQALIKDYPKTKWAEQAKRDLATAWAKKALAKWSSRP